MRKWTRTKKILAVVLSAAMVLTLNTAAFAEEAERDVITFADDGDAIVKNTTNPLSWNMVDNAEAIHAVLQGQSTDEHLANNKKIPVSSNDTSTISASVIKLDGYDDLTLWFGYKTEDGGLNAVEGEEGKIPTAHYDGRKKEFNKKGKSSGSKHEDVDAYLALVKYDAASKIATEIGGVTVGSLKMKDNVDANISLNAITKKEGERAVHPKLEGKDLATFTVKPKIKFDKADSVDKGVKKAITAALKDKTYKLAIEPMEIMTGDLVSYAPNGKVSENTVKYVGDNFDWNVFATKLNIKGSTPKADLAFKIELENHKEVIKKINKKDYTLTTGTVGGETVAVVDAFTSTNYVFSGAYVRDGFESHYDPGYKIAMRLKGKKNIVYGAYKADNDAYVDSVE
ncbi:hypothetical protein SAMN06296386_103256 [Lachnospiraceae bacterium]|nr:hypothetical protein SAMN06296386_103256 [Lachnospiraceae bacterium]